MNPSGGIAAGIDFGPHTEAVVSYAAYFAGKMRTTVRLIYVIDYLMSPPAYLASYIEEEKDRDEKAMEEWIKKLADLRIEARGAVVMGRLHESFSKTLRELQPEILVLGYETHLLRPSSSERLIKSLKTSMLVLRGKTAEEASLGSLSINRILCAVDFSENSLRAAIKAESLARLLSAELEVLHVVPSHRISEKAAQWKISAGKAPEESDAPVIRQARADMAELCRKAGVEKEGTILAGDPHELIASEADARGCDLIVSGARGLSYIEGVLVGSTTDAVLRSANRPVLIVH